MTLFLCFLIFCLLLTFIAPDLIVGTLNPDQILTVQIVGLLIIAIVIFRKILFYRCSVCKKWFSMVKHSSTRVGGIEEQYYADDAISKRTGVRDIHEIMYRCKNKNCGFVKNKRKSGKLRKV